MYLQSNIHKVPKTLCTQRKRKHAMRVVEEQLVTLTREFRDKHRYLLKVCVLVDVFHVHDDTSTVAENWCECGSMRAPLVVHPPALIDPPLCSC